MAETQRKSRFVRDENGKLVRTDAPAEDDERRRGQLSTVYEKGRRDEPFISDLKQRDRALRGARADDPDDLCRGRGDTFAGNGWRLARATIQDALGGESKNRL